MEGEPVFTVYCRSGQVIITGARSKIDAIAAMKRLEILLEPFMFDEQTDRSHLVQVSVN
jgi:TATA-box binding protein (TBP) (component of TFIID and TFIIIB)